MWDLFRLNAEVFFGYYFIIVGALFLLFYVWKKKQLFRLKIQPKFPRNKDYVREIGYSILSMFIFIIIMLLLSTNSFIKNHSRYYEDIHKHGKVYFFLAFLIMPLLHDTYFYWTHRFMHHPKVFRIVHLVHHKSVNPSPWAAFSFHPIEAVITANFVPLLIFFMPIHLFHLTYGYIFMFVHNVYGHLGYEIMSKKYQRHLILRWLNSSVIHNNHHKFFRGNYGLYFVWWDKIMGTYRAP